MADFETYLEEGRLEKAAFTKKLLTDGASFLGRKLTRNIGQLPGKTVGLGQRAFSAVPGTGNLGAAAGQAARQGTMRRGFSNQAFNREGGQLLNQLRQTAPGRGLHNTYKFHKKIAPWALGTGAGAMVGNAGLNAYFGTQGQEFIPGAVADTAFNVALPGWSMINSVTGPHVNNALDLVKHRRTADHAQAFGQELQDSGAVDQWRRAATASAFENYRKNPWLFNTGATGYQDFMQKHSPNLGGLMNPYTSQAKPQTLYTPQDTTPWGFLKSRFTNPRGHNQIWDQSKVIAGRSAAPYTDNYNLFANEARRQIFDQQGNLFSRN